MTKFKKPEEAIQAAYGGSNSCDMSVGDIYGGKYESLGLNENILASLFGKLQGSQEDLSNVEESDISRSLLTLLCINLT